MFLINMIDDEGIDVDEIIEVCPSIINSMIQHLEDFEDAEEFEKRYFTFFNLEDFDKYSRSTYYSANIKPLQKYLLEDVGNQIWENANYLKKIKEEIEQSKTLENNLSKSISKNETKLNTAKKKMSSVQRKRENLQGTRDTIQICKLLTNTSFTYEHTYVSGHVIGQISKTINCFELNSDELSRSEITNILYDILKKVSADVRETEVKGKEIRKKKL